MSKPFDQLFFFYVYILECAHGFQKTAESMRLPVDATRNFRLFIRHCLFVLSRSVRYVNTNERSSHFTLLIVTIVTVIFFAQKIILNVRECISGFMSKSDVLKVLKI